MGKIVIKKRVSLDFLGEEYKDAYLTFQSIPAGDFGTIMEEVEKVGEDNNKSIEFILNTLQKYFVEGKFPDGDTLGDVTKEDLMGLDAEATVKCFARLTGQELDPKADSPSTNPSTTEATTTA